MAVSAPYGSWESPITASFITEAGVGLGGLSVGPASGDLFWLERRPKEGGRSVLCRRAPADPAASERGGVDVTSEGMNVRTRVHEYGGNAHILGKEEGGVGGGECVVFANFADQRLYKTSTTGGGEPLELTPKAAYDEDARYRFADFALDEPRNRLICVREDHTKPEPAHVANAVVAVALDGSGTMEVLASGSDFYAAPRLSPDGTKLAFIHWEHPNMPWDSTRLSVLELGSDGKPQAGAAPTVVAGADGETSVLQPAWSPRTGELFFVSDRDNGFWNLHYVPSDTVSSPLGDGWAQAAVNVMPLKADFSGAAPGWALGQQGYTFARGTGAVLASIRLPGEATSTLLALDGDSPHGELSRHSSAAGGLPFGFGGVCTKEDGTLYLLGSSPEMAGGIYEWAGLPAASPPVLLASSMRVSSVPPAKFISTPQLLQFPTTDKAETGVRKAYGYYYPPRNGDFAPAPGELPPLLVKAHGGPTACTGSSFNPGIQFWTSRGFAVMDVDYRGSTGYGRAYRQALAGNWGVVDIEDVCAAAKYLAKQGLADAKRLCIDGGSAGGFTTLGALAFEDVFAAGCSLYGVADCSALAADTHKFESRYLDGLIGKYPEEKAKYDSRSAIYSTETLSCPVLLLQGDEDKIVPPNQAETMHKVLLEKGIATALKVCAIGCSIARRARTTASQAHGSQPREPTPCVPPCAPCASPRPARCTRVSSTASARRRTFKTRSIRSSSSSRKCSARASIRPACLRSQSTTSRPTSEFAHDPNRTTKNQSITPPAATQ
jgi:dipeptidyl aminopeptidase/acylaminoacyl peptidase